MDSPLRVTSTYVMEGKPIEEQGAWYNPIEDTAEVRPVDSKTWQGWSGSLEQLRAKVEGKSYLGIVAFSQGAAAAGVLTALYPDAFKFVILVSGFTPLDPEVSALYPSEPISVPSLHVMGTTDPYVSIDRCEMLAGKFANPCIMTHGGGHIMPPKELLKPIKKWVGQFKN